MDSTMCSTIDGHMNGWVDGWIDASQQFAHFARLL